MLEPGPEYPKASYRLGSQVDVWGRMMDIRVLDGPDDETTALLEGWALHPFDITEDHEDDALTIVETPVRNKGGRPRKIPLEG